MSPRVDELRVLAHLLSAGDMDQAECEKAAQALAGLRDDPEFVHLDALGFDDGARIEAALPSVLADFILMSDKIDELHEQLIEQFGDAVPEFPEAFWGAPVDDYYRWVDECLAGLRADEGGMCMVRTLRGMDDHVVAAVVLRKDTAPLLDLGRRLGVGITLAALEA